MDCLSQMVKKLTDGVLHKLDGEEVLHLKNLMKYEDEGREINFSGHEV